MEEGAATAGGNVPTTATTVEDPLIAALPPATDYLSYLTILEYQLTPKNLPILNRLLQEDDGTLATEIGWDLLKLILPILRVEPEHARKCLDIIARRGNPREVIVRVSEELEALGKNDSEDEAEDVEGEDGLPTFAGEAPRVHLGDMKLKGMPDQASSPEYLVQQDRGEGPDAAVEELKLQALLSMLSILHPRIRTQYPSRFLATSLPAALSAYRRLSMNADSTLAFLNTLTQFAGKRRPMLPPRKSTSDVLNSSAPLPDPESKIGSVGATEQASANEAAIIQRLLQAVLLEVVDEHIASSSEAHPPLTARLRTNFGSHSITSARKAEVYALTTNDEAKRADQLRAKFVTVAQDLKLDIVDEITTLAYLSDEAEPEAPDEYPTSPAQIPFSGTGLLLLYSEHLCSSTTQANSNASDQIDTPTVLTLIDRQYENDHRLRTSPPAIDSLLSLLYLIFCTPAPALVPTTSAADSQHTAATAPDLSRTQTAIVESQTLLLATHNILRDIFTSLPDADSRDNAHHIASHLIHGHCQRSTRLKILRSILETNPEDAPSKIQEVQGGGLKAVGIDWLKAELFPTPSTQQIMSRLQTESERSLKISDMAVVVDLVFPLEKIPQVPDADKSEQEKERVLETFAAELPFYIAALNLLCLITRKHHELAELEEPSASTATQVASEVDQCNSTEEIIKKGEQMLLVLGQWTGYLNAELVIEQERRQKTGKKHDDGEPVLEVEGVAVADVFSLSDAVGRAMEALVTDAAD